MADETLRFDIVGEDHLSEPLGRAGDSAGTLSRHMDAAARSAAVLDEALKRQNTAARVSVDATLALARADKILEDAEHGLRDGALEAEFALKRQADAAKQSGAAAAKAAAENRGLAAALQKVADNAKKSGPGLLPGAALALTPAIATIGGVAAGASIGIAGAAVAGTAALAAFGAVAKPVLSDALKAEQAVQTAQDNYNAAIAGGTKQAVAYKAEQIAINKAYSELSPAQIALSKQLGDMANAWQNLKAAQTPVVAGALVPWLKSVTDLTKNLAPIIRVVSPVIQQLGVYFDALINSPQFKAFRDFIANTGSASVSAAGGTLIDLIDAFIVLLPKFNPLIEKAVGWIGALGPAVLKWSASGKASADITKFMAWFTANGPVVGGLLKNIGAALAALAPGLTAGGTAELKIISDFFGWVAKLPKGIAGPLAETAGALLLLNKLGVVSVGVKIVGAAAKWLTGGVVNLGGGAAAGAEIRAAMVSGGTAAAAEIRAAMTGAPAGAAGAAGKAGGAGAGAGAAAGGAAALGVAAAGALIGAMIRAVGDALSPQGTFAGMLNKDLQNLGTPISTSLLHSFTLGGLEAKLTTEVGMPVGRVENNILSGAKIWGSTLTSGISGTWSNIAGGAKTWWGNITGTVSGAWNGLTGGSKRTTSGITSDFTHMSSVIAGAMQQSGRAADTFRTSSLLPLVGATGKVSGGIQGLQGYLNTLHAGSPYSVRLNETGVGNFTITQGTSGHAGGTPTGGRPGAAAGMYVAAGTGPTADDVLIRASRGELVVPAHLVAGGLVDHLRGAIPGFAAGGSIGALAPATTAFNDRFITAVTAAMEKAMTTAMKAAVAAATAAAAAVRNVAGGASGTNAQNIALAKKMAAEFGWTGAEWTALLAIIMQESGGSATIKNPGSSASGIAQNIAGFGPGYQYGNAAQQINWMLNYIKGRYGDPIAAESFHLANNYYDRGGWLQPGLTMAYNGTGRPERVTAGGGDDPLVAELRALRAELRQLTGVASSIPQRTGQHVGAAVNSAASAASFRVRYP